MNGGRSVPMPGHVAGSEASCSTWPLFQLLISCALQPIPPHHGPRCANLWRAITISPLGNLCTGTHLSFRAAKTARNPPRRGDSRPLAKDFSPRFIPLRGIAPARNDNLCRGPPRRQACGNVGGERLMRHVLVVTISLFSALALTSCASSPPAEKVPEGMRAPRVVQRVKPEYPEELRKQRVAGSVVIAGTVPKEGGTLRDPRVVDSTDARLNQYALDAVAQWVWAPGLQNGQAVDVQLPKLQSRSPSSEGAGCRPGYRMGSPLTRPSATLSRWERVCESRLFRTSCLKVPLPAGEGGRRPGEGRALHPLSSNGGRPPPVLPADKNNRAARNRLRVRRTATSTPRRARGEARAAWRDDSAPRSRSSSRRRDRSCATAPPEERAASRCREWTSRNGTCA